MAHRSWGLLVGLLVLSAVGAQAADEIPTGNYKLTILQVTHQLPLWLVKLEPKDGKWKGEILAAQKLEDPLPPVTVSDVTVTADQLHFRLKTEDGQVCTFDGKLPLEGKKVLGSLDLFGGLFPAQLELTTLKSFDRFDQAKETISSSSSSATEVFDAAKTLMRLAGENKVKPEEVRSWASKALKMAEPYGHRWELEMAKDIAGSLADQKEFSAEALQFANRAERSLLPTDKPSLKWGVLAVKRQALKTAAKEDEAKSVEADIEKINLVKLIKFPGRKAKADQVVAVELFTGAECPPCVAADIAFDALGKTYSSKDVVLLQYHLHIPGPDPLTNADTEARQKYYDIGGTPSIFFNGKAGAEGGGSMDSADEKYDEFVKAVNPLLEKQAKAELKLSALQKGTKVEIAGSVENLVKSDDALRLRFVLVEQKVDYRGRNKLFRYFHVVRDLPGGAKGFALKDKSSKHTASVDLDELRKKLTDYLDNYRKRPFPNKERPLELKNLRVVALLQNDETKEVLQATQVEIKGGE